MFCHITGRCGHNEIPITSVRPKVQPNSRPLGSYVDAFNAVRKSRNPATEALKDWARDLCKMSPVARDPRQTPPENLSMASFPRETFEREEAARNAPAYTCVPQNLNEDDLYRPRWSTVQDHEPPRGQSYAPQTAMPPRRDERETSAQNVFGNWHNPERAQPSEDYFPGRAPPHDRYATYSEHSRSSRYGLASSHASSHEYVPQEEMRQPYLPTPRQAQQSHHNDDEYVPPVSGLDDFYPGLPRHVTHDSMGRQIQTSVILRPSVHRMIAPPPPETTRESRIRPYYASPARPATPVPEPSTVPIRVPTPPTGRKQRSPSLTSSTRAAPGSGGGSPNLTTSPMEASQSLADNMGAARTSPPAPISDPGAVNYLGTTAKESATPNHNQQKDASVIAHCRGRASGPRTVRAQHEEEYMLQQQEHIDVDDAEENRTLIKRPRGRPPGSRNKPRDMAKPQKTVQTGQKRRHQSANDSDDEYASESVPSQPNKRLKARDETVGILQLELAVAFTAGGNLSKKGLSQGYQRTPPGVDPPSAKDCFQGQPCQEHYEELAALLPQHKDVAFNAIDEELLKHHNTNVTNEIQLWAICWQRFQATPYEIFKYGLWPELQDRRAVNITLSDGDSGKHISPFLSRGEVDHLRLLIGLPCWDDRIEKFRYVLMCAVAYRVKDHDDPLVPIRAKQLKRFEEQIGPLPLDANQKSLLFYQQTKNSIMDDPNIRKICQALQSISPSETSESDIGKRVFLLKVADLVRVRKAINMVFDKVSGHRLFPSLEASESAWERIGKNLVPKQWPRDRDLNHVRTSAILRFRMEHKCRLVLQGQHASDRKTPHHLYLVDFRDLSSTAHFYDNIQAGLSQGNILGPTQTQLDVLRGLIVPARGPYMESMPVEDTSVTEAFTVTSPHASIDPLGAGLTNVQNAFQPAANAES